MPPEPLPGDRKEFGFKDRKNERVPGCDALGGGSSSPANLRWREPYHGPRGDFSRASPRRSAPDHYRQGSAFYQGYPEDSGGGGHGCTPSLSGDRFWPEEESFRLSSARYGGGKSGGSSGRESRGSFRRSPYWGSGDLARQHHEPPPPPTVTGQRSLAVPVSPISHISSQNPLKDPHDKSGGAVDDGSVAGRSYDRDREHSLGSMGWKPLKWTRPCSLSSLKAARSESDEAGFEVSVPAGKETPIQSPMTSPLPSDEGAYRKKQRLTWGQGLAKHEKQKVEGSSDAVRQMGSVQCASSIKAASDDMSPKIMGVAGCTSPATLCSVVSSSSPAGLEDKPCIKEAHNHTSHPNNSSGLVLQNCSEEFSIKLDPLEANTISSLSSLLADLLQPEDACSGDSSFTRHTTMTKLLVLKGDISKELEKTECEIDLLENELKTLTGDGKNDCCQSSFTSHAACASDPSLRLADVTLKMPLDSIPSKDNVLVSSMTPVRELLLYTDSLEEDDVDVDVKDATDDSLGPLSSSKSAFSAMEISNSHIPKLSECSIEDDERPATVGGHGEGNGLVAGSTSDSSGHDMSPNCTMDDNLIALIMGSNRDAAKIAFQEFDKAWSTELPQCDIWGPDYIFYCRRNDMHVKEKLAIRKRLCKFKERVLALKFRAFHYLWKEDLRLLFIRKNRPKSQKRFEFGSRSSHSGSQRHRSSIRSRFTLPAGNLTLVPTTEIVDFTSKLLSHSPIKIYRKNEHMPSLLLDENEKKYSRFVSYNGLIEDPVAFEEERAMINPWTQQEIEVFKEMLATYGKNFTKISSFLTHKTTADCVKFYYINHKSESFSDVKKQLDLRKQWRCSSSNTYLVTSGKKWNPEVNAASLHMLGDASTVAASSNGNARNLQKSAGRSVPVGFHDMKVIHGSHGFLERASSVEISRHERETSAADVLAGICGALSSEAMSSCVTSSIGPAEKMNYVTIDRPLTPEVTQNIDEEDTCSDEGCGEQDSVYWTDDEKSLLIRALSMYGKDFARISRFVGTRSREQCKIFFSKARKCLGLDIIHPGPDIENTPTSETNGGRSDTDDGCAPEIDSAICSTQSCSKLDADFTQSVANTGSDGFVPAENTPMHSETDRSSEQYEVGGSNLEEVEGKADMFTSVLHDEKVARGRENYQSDNLKENNDSPLRYNETVKFHEVSEFVNRKTEEGGNAHAVPSPVKPVITASMEVEQLKPLAAEKFQGDIGGIFTVEGLGSQGGSHQLMVPTSAFVSRQQIKVDLIADNTVSPCSPPNSNNSVSLCFAPDSNESENVSNSGKKVTLSSSFAFAPNYPHQIPLELFSCLQKQSLPLNKVLPDPSSIGFDDPQRVVSHSIFNFEEQGKRRHQKNSVSREFYQQCLIGNLSPKQFKHPLHILSGFPLQVLNHKEAKREAAQIGEIPVQSVNLSKKNGISQPNQFHFSDINREKSNVSPTLNSQCETHPMRSVNQPVTKLRPCSQNSLVETEEQPQRTGDVKLFGQILSHPTSQQKSNSSLQECDSRPLSPKQNRGPGELPLRSYGFWDGSRIQTGYSSLPESAIMLAKYQGSMVGESFYLGKDGVSSSNGVLADCQPAYLQALAADGKRPDRFSELQKLNGFEMVSRFQQQGGPMLGVNMVGGSGILVSGGGVVSDPVAALKMNYAGRSQILTSEVESWMGDVGGS